MAGNHDYVALDWVKGEIDSTLTQAQVALEDFVKNPEDSTKLRFCLNYIHQVHGTLQMVEFYGAALLAEEMEHLTQALLKGGLAHEDEAIEVLMRAILQLPNYLSRLQTSQRDLPVILLPILNDLRASRGAGLLSDTSLFTPDLGLMRLPVPEAAKSRLHNPKIVAQLRKLRQMFQFSLAGVIREKDLDVNLGYLMKVAKKLQSLCRETSYGQLWRLASGFVEGIQQKSIELTSGTKNVLRSLDHSIKILIDESIDILGKRAPEDLTKHILYYIARAESESPNLVSISKDFRLDLALPDEQMIDEERQKMAGPDKGAITSVVGALNEELARVKDQLDLFVRGEYKDVNDLLELIPGLQQVSNTMAVLGLGMPRKVIEDQIKVIEQLAEDGAVPDDNDLMDIAGALLYVEASLSGYGEEESRGQAASDGMPVPSEQVTSAHEAVIREARNGLEQAKTDIVEYIASHWDKAEIQAVPALLQSIRGGLKIIPLDQAAELLEACSRFINERLLANEEAPDWSQLDTLADAITSIEYYLERLSEGSRDNDMILEVAEQSLAQLGYPVGEAAEQPVAPAVETVATAPPAVASPAPAAAHEKETDKELIDDEIIEIFVEEAAEVLETIHEFYPAFQANPDDQKALAEIRRAYHTLKGSGRLVGATTIGELAWAVENMLNRVIEGSITTSMTMFELLEQVNAKLPELIESYKNGDAVSDVSSFIETAESLAAARKQAREASRAEAAKAAEEFDHSEVVLPDAATIESIAESEDSEEQIISATPSAPEQTEEVPETASAAEITTETIITAEPPAEAETADEDDMIDDEIIEIFVEEAAEVLENIHEHLPKYLASYDNQDALIEVRRAFHTLKGSGRLVGASVVGELAWSIENMLNRVIDGTIFMNDATGELISEVVNIMPELVTDFEQRRKPTINPEPLMEQANAISKGEIPTAPAKAATLPEAEAAQGMPAAEIPAEPSGAAAADEMAIDEESALSELGTDPALLDIFITETEGHLDSLGNFISDARQADGGLEITDELSRAMHTLKGSANTAGITPIAVVAVPVEKFVKEARANGIRVDTRFADLLADAGSFIRKGLDQVKTTPLRPIESTDQFLEMLQSCNEDYLSAEAKMQAQALEGQPDPQLINLFLTEGVDILLDADRILNEWSEDHTHTDEVEKLVDELTSLAEGALTAGLPDVASLAQTLENLYEAAAGNTPAEEEFYATAKLGHEALISMMDQVAAGLATQPQPELINQINELADSLLAPEELEEILPEMVEQLEDVQETLETKEQVEDQEPAEAAEEDIPVLEEAYEEGEDGELQSFELDPDLAEVFLEEANDLIISSGETIQQWTENLANLDLVRALQRDLHTLKGGARLAGIMPIGDLAHELESLFEGIVEGRIAASEEACNLSLLAHDTLSGMVESVSTTAACTDAPDLIAALQGYIVEHKDRDEKTGEPEVAAEAMEEVPEAEDIPVLEEAAGLDPEMVEIFLEEAHDIIQRTGEVLHDWSEDLHNSDHLAQLQRDLHTLKGGARMAEIKSIGDLAHELETLFERLNEGRLGPAPDMVNLVNAAHDSLATMIDNVEAQQPVAQASGLIRQIQDMAAAAPEVSAPLSEPTPAAEEAPEPASADAFEDIDTSHIENEIHELEDLDQELVSIFLEEANDLIDSTAQNLQTWLNDIDNISEVKELQRALHTLKGGARLAEIKPIGDLSHELENLFEGIVETKFEAETSLSNLMLQCHDRLAEMVEQVSNAEPIAAANDLILRIHHYCNHHAKGGLPVSDALSDIEQEQHTLQSLAGETTEEELRAIFLDESRDIMEAVVDCFDRWKTDPDNVTPAKELARDLNTLNGGAKLANAESVSSLAESLSNRMETIADGAHQVSDETISTIDRSIKYILRLLDQIEELEEPVIPKELINEINQLDAGELVETEKFVLDVDPEILQVFIEEADELQTALEREFADWGREPRNENHADHMARSLHTLKGGARLASLEDIGDLAQELESVVKDALEHKAQLDDPLRGEIDPLFNRLKKAIKRVKDYYEQSQLEADAQSEAAAKQEDLTERMVQLQREHTAGKEVSAGKDKPTAPAPQQQRQAPAETVRVSAPLLDSLVNLAGETSIARGLLEQQISDFAYTLEEMQATIDRLREQLRRMDIETEAQILFSLEKEGGPEYEDFDPLEMDRYSSIQQLSRALSESTFDLTDLRETMLNKARDAETLLLQQSRINTELQEGLMKTRMVPFTSTVPRLRRIVRQVCGELGKKVDFEVYNPEGELDRTVLERMVAPLEHMVRNAVDHGVETPAERKAAGKSETGRIELSVGREGGDVVLVLSDDGAGINVGAVRQKAIKQGLIDDKTTISDHDVLQFIFHAGFSTAKKVTQISGRGVGMDVVSSEIKQLGGRVSIDSKPGKGTRFVVHLPFTVSVNRALMVNTGDDYYAIPLNTIEGIVRVSTYELEEYYKPEAPLYEYAGQQYRLEYLGSLLKSGHFPKLHGQPLPLPVILVRGGDQPLALQVDSLMGSREIVVKGLGPQFAKVRGVSGATILGDGSVVVILDLPALLRSDFTANIVMEELEPEAAAEADNDRPTKVMVVDDSVTVRKVTSRLLERNGMEVVLAKDGVDAIALLQDHKPDVMLLDIEMPRMDGFEVASLVRHDSRLKDVPIIMITSRTGQKHRDRAMSIGVNEYLGKPFQEGNLLDTIGKLVE